MFFVLRRRRVRRRRRKASVAKQKHYSLNKEAARKVIVQRVAELNVHYGYTYTGIAIRKQRARWGSCSRKGNLNFNYVIASLPQRLMDYVIVHELCHLAAFNHSATFWTLVAQTLFDYKDLRKELQSHGRLLK